MKKWEATMYICVAASLMIGPFIVARTRGDSMEPALPDHAAAVVARFLPPRIGDIVVFKYHGTLIMHRVTAIKGDMVVTRGDNPKYHNNPETWPITSYVGRAIIPAIPEQAIYIAATTWIILVTLIGIKAIDESLETATKPKEAAC